MYTSVGLGSKIRPNLSTNQITGQTFASAASARVPPPCEDACESAAGERSQQKQKSTVQKAHTSISKHGAHETRKQTPANQVRAHQEITTNSRAIVGEREREAGGGRHWSAPTCRGLVRHHLCTHFGEQHRLFHALRHMWHAAAGASAQMTRLAAPALHSPGACREAPVRG